MTVAIGTDATQLVLTNSNTMTLSSRTVNETRAQISHGDLQAPPTDPFGPAVSIAGVGQWRAGVDLARQWGARTVAVALDADAREVEAVARAQHALVRALRREGLDVQLWQWPAEQGKGLDDFLRGRSATGG